MTTLYQGFKNILKYILPMPARSQNREFNSIRANIQKQEKQLQQTVLQLEEKQAEILNENKKEREAMAASLLEVLNELQKDIVDTKNQNAALRDSLSEEINVLKNKLENQQQQVVLEVLNEFRKDMDDTKNQNAALRDSLSEEINVLKNRLENQQQQAMEHARLEVKKSEELLKKEMQQMADNLSKFANTENKNIDYLKKVADEGRRYASEAVWAEIFNNTVKGSAWCAEVSYSPGRWAVGYPYLYVMYRVLNETSPKEILELGLGQSTRMIGQYAATHEGVEHTVVEHDEKWIDFCRNDFSLSPNSQILRLDREFIPYKEAEAVRVFKGFRENFEGKKFDFISIDAPFGGDMKEYSRIDVLQLLPDILSENFVIMIDDLERKQEQNTVNEMIKVLKNNDIPFETGKYSGKKDCMIICAEHLGFLASL